MRSGVRGRQAHRWVALPITAAMAATLIAACSSTPTAPSASSRPTTNAPPPAITPAPSVTVTPPRDASTASVATPFASLAPLSPAAMLARAAAASGNPPLPVPPPVSAAVAARFPEPAIVFATPAFEGGRQAFTRIGELHDVLAGLERDAALGDAAAAPRTRVQLLALGSSQGGLPIEALAFTRALVVEPAPLAAALAASSVPAPPQPSRRPAVIIVAGQHGDEPAGGEALIVLAQELAAGRLEPVLAKVDVILVPRANPDAAALFQREASDGSDVDRDHLLLRTPEAQALARLQSEVAPVVMLEMQEYAVYGPFVDKLAAWPRFDAQLQYATVANMAPFVTRAAEEWFRLPLIASLRSAGLGADWLATTSADAADRRFSMGGIGPQLGRNAAGLRHAVSLVVATRGGGMGRADLKRRVQTQLVAVRSVLASASLHAADLAKLHAFVDRDTASKACRGEVVIEAAPTSSEYALSVLDRETGAIRRVDVAWDSALELRPLKSRARPCGYWLAASETEAVRHLRLLGIDVQQMDEGAELRGESWRELSRSALPAAAAPSPGTLRIAVQTVPALLDIAAGGYYVPLDQPLANLAIAALEPESPAGFAANRLIESVASSARILQRPSSRMTAVP